jgi:CDP-diacylglycerol--serine O-phosphatidyltransferase
MMNGVGRRLRRGAYLLPSAFTIGNMLLGFYAIVRAYRGDFRDAAVMVMVAGVLDGLDGRIARLTGTDSEFGKEYDSLADVFTFGVAPALLSYFWGLEEHGRLGWLIPLFYLVCTATRLARFNVQTKVIDSRYFVGLPSPAAAGGVVSVLFFAPDDDWKPWAAAALAGSLVILGTLMVSTFRYRSFKKVNLRQRWSYRVMLPVAAVLLVAAYHPQAFFLAVAVAYTVSGPLGWLMARVSRKPNPA